MKLHYFLLGMISLSCLNSLFSDILGKEAFVNYVQNNWIDSRITIPIAILGLIYVIASIIIERDKAK